jgi:hypothetical protein
MTDHTAVNNLLTRPDSTMLPGCHGLLSNLLQSMKVEAGGCIVCPVKVTAGLDISAKVGDWQCTGQPA